MAETIVEDFLDRNKSDIQNIIKISKKKNRKSLILMVIGFVVCVVGGWIITLFYPEIFDSNNKWTILWIILFFIPPWFFAYFLGIQKLDLRKTFISQFATLVDPNLIYEFKPTTFPLWLNDPRLIGPHEDLFSYQNHILYKTTKNVGADVCTIILEGMEVMTLSSQKRDKICCHAFITEIRFPEGKLKIDTDIWAHAEKGSLIPGFEDSKSFGITQNKVFLESNDFEKIFDVYSLDQIKAREVLNPHTMQALMNFMNSFDKSRSYDFLFTKDSIFIRFNLLRSKDRSIFYKYDALTAFKDHRVVLRDFYAEFIRFKNIIKDFDPFSRR